MEQLRPTKESKLHQAEPAMRCLTKGPAAGCWQPQASCERSFARGAAQLKLASELQAHYSSITNYINSKSVVVVRPRHVHGQAADSKTRFWRESSTGARRIQSQWRKMMMHRQWRRLRHCVLDGSLLTCTLASQDGRNTAYWELFSHKDFQDMFSLLLASCKLMLMTIHRGR